MSELEKELVKALRLLVRSLTLDELTKALHNGKDLLVRLGEFYDD